MIIYIIVTMAIGYLLGCFQTGYFIGRRNHIDIRDYGSGNSGATNVLRTLGKLPSLLTFLGDALKGFLWVLLIKYYLGPVLFHLNEQNTGIVALLAGFAVVLGHNYPFQMGFKGGKGISTTAAVMCAFDVRLGICSFLIFVLIVFFTRYVSLASICLSIALLVEMYIFTKNWIYVALTLLYTVSAVYRHRANIGRLLSGTESKIGQKVEIKK